MKLAEALMERKAIKNKMEELKKRIYQNAQIQEGDIPIELPLSLLEELKQEIEKFESLVIRINNTNVVSKLSNGITLMDAIVKKDMLNYEYLIYVNLADKATPSSSRYSSREIKSIPNIDVNEIRKKADEIEVGYINSAKSINKSTSNPVSANYWDSIFTYYD